MTDLDDLLPRAKPPAPVNFESMSIAELEDFILRLEADIGRAREAIKGKQAARGSADAVFGPLKR